MKIPSLLGRRFQVDFAQARTPVAPFAWLLVGVGVLGLAGALADFGPRWIERARLRQECADVQARMDSLPGVAHRSDHAPDPVGLAQARGVLAELDRPWPALFDQFESIGAPDVHLVQLGIDSRFQTVRMLAESTSLDRVVQFGQRFSGNGPVRSARLTHHEWRNAPAGRIVVADLTADLVPPPPARKGVP